MGKSERNRTREPEPEQEKTRYDQAMEFMEEVRGRKDNPMVVRGEEQPWVNNRQGRMKYYSHLTMDDAVLPDLRVFKHEIADKSGRHTHNGSLVVFGVEGQGETLMNGTRYEWERGDLILFPIVPGGIEHQHFNRNDPDEPATWLATISDPFWAQVGAMFKQEEQSPHWEDHGEDGDHYHYEDEKDAYHYQDYNLDEWRDYEPPEEVDTLYDELIRERDIYRKQIAKAKQEGHMFRVRADDVEYEWNPQGKTKWYLHPAYDDRSIRTFLYSVQEIPPGSRSGKQHRQGGIVHYILEGEGHSVVNGEKKAWKADDFLGLPIRPDGHTVQHFNDDPENPVRMMRAEPYFHSALGVDLGVGFEQIESCPEF